MSHEVIQVIKLVKYNRKLHEMISATCKAYRQWQIHKNEHSHEMTRFLEPNRRLVFTARTGTNLRIIQWIGLRIACASCPQRVRI